MGAMPIGWVNELFGGRPNRARGVRFLESVRAWRNFT